MNRTITVPTGSVPTGSSLAAALGTPAHSGSTTPTGFTRRNGPTALTLRDGFWRILHPSGAVLGYIERSRTADGDQFEARRLIAGTTRIMPLGEFWSLDTALDCFGY